MKTCILAITDEGKKLAQKIASSFSDCHVLSNDDKVSEKLRAAWNEYEAIVCIMATGIVVRSIAPLIKDKTGDPCVVVLDQRGKFVISLLSGHLGGGNQLSIDLANITGGQPVITTASDVAGRTALDLWAERNNLLVTDKKELTTLSARVVNGHIPALFSEVDIDELPDDFTKAGTEFKADIIVTYKKTMTLSALYCIPEVLFFGIGCNRGTSAEDIEIAFQELCDFHDIDTRSVGGLASVDVKNDEEGLLQFAADRELALDFFSRDELNSVENVSFSKAAMKAVGVQGVAEPAAILAARKNNDPVELIIRKMKWKDVTMAVALRKYSRFS